MSRTAVLDRLGQTVDAIDVFCGGGGSSQGIHEAGAEVIGAANHSPHAIGVHARNFPNTEHFRADLVDEDSADYIDPAHLPRARFAWFSPSCRHHSQANAKKVYDSGPAALFDDEDPEEQEAYANSERSRVTMMCVARYMDARRPDIVVVENVVEVCSWGPNRDGSTFRDWYDRIQKLGYNARPLFLNSMFFAPCPQSRDRVYFVFWKQGHPAPDLDYRPPALCTSDRCGGKMVGAKQSFKKRTKAWKMEQWGKYGRQYVYRCPDCGDTVHPVAWPALSAIDLSNLGPTMAERRAVGGPNVAGGMLKPNTEARVRRGILKYRNGPAVLMPARDSRWGVDRPATEPMPTQTSRQEQGMATADGMVVPVRTNGTARHAGEQTPTAVAGNAGMALVIRNYGGADEVQYRAHHAAGPLGAITANGTSQALVTDIGNAGSDARYDASRTRHAGEPAQTVLTGGQLGLVMPVGGNDHEREGQTRVRNTAGEPFQALTATQSWGHATAPFLIEMRGGGSVKAGQHTVTEPMHTVSAQGMHHGLSTPPLFSKINGGPDDTTWHHAGVDPLNTITGRDTTGLIPGGDPDPKGKLIIPWVDQWRSDPAAITEQLATVMTHLRHALASMEPSDEPITDDEWDQVRFRMLEPEYELRRAMAFADDYHLHVDEHTRSTKAQMTALLGNAVTPPVARWITHQCMATFDLAA